MAKKKIVKKDTSNETKRKVWLIINFALIMIFGVLIAIWSEVIGIAYVASTSMVNDETFNLTVDIVKNANHVMNKSIAISVGLYSLCQLINYISYLFKKKKMLFVLMILELAAAISIYFTNGNVDIFVVPVLSATIYLRVLDLEEE